MNEITLLSLATAFAGGLVGAAIGGMRAFAFCGLTFLLGTLWSYFNPGSFVNGAVAWGPFFGPHVAFAGAVGAAGYAASRGLVHSGRDLTTALIRLRSPIVLAMGGLFGIAGFCMQILFTRIPQPGGTPWINSIALSIAVNALAVRRIFGKTNLFCCRGKYLSWQTLPSRPLHLLLVICVSAFGSAIFNTSFPASTGILFGISFMFLLPLLVNRKAPVILHIVWASEYGTFITGDLSWGAALGIFTGIFGEVCARYCLVYGDTHIDPPALSLAVTLTVIPLLISSGLIHLFNGFSFILPVIVTGAGIVLMGRFEKQMEHIPPAPPEKKNSDPLGG